MIGPAGFMAAPRPAWGAAPIRCGKMKCKWRGYETDLVEVQSKKFGPGVTQKICPTCGCDNYMHMTEREIGAWEKTRTAAIESKVGA